MILTERSLGAFLKEILRRRGQTHADFAEAVGVNHNHISRVLNNRSPASTRLIVVMARVLELDPFQLATMQARRGVWDYLVEQGRPQLQEGVSRVLDDDRDR